MRDARSDARIIGKRTVIFATIDEGLSIRRLIVKKSVCQVTLKGGLVLSHQSTVRKRLWLGEHEYTTRNDDNDRITNEHGGDCGEGSLKPRYLADAGRWRYGFVRR